MKVLSDTETLSTDAPIACAMGVYDGVHLGHQAIIKELHKKAQLRGKKCVVTFSPHPAEILTCKPTSLIVSLAHRLHLLELYGIDYVLVLPFTPLLAAQPYDEFLHTLRKKIPFSWLIFGEGSSFGKDRLGTEPKVRLLSQALGFDVIYLKKETHHKEVIASGAIRKAIRACELKKIKKMLGRPYSIWVPYSPADSKRENETLCKWSTTCHYLCPLPNGVYGVDLETTTSKTAAIAFVNATTDLQRKPMLTLDLFFDTPPPAATHLNIAFVDYLHEAIDVNTLETFLSSTKQKLSPQPT
ncbi:MAG: FAD synthetase family protein [Chlamydiota bacterium]